MRQAARERTQVTTNTTLYIDLKGAAAAAYPPWAPTISGSVAVQTATPYNEQGA